MRSRSLLLFGVVLFLGCGDSRHATVSGTVTMDGKPLPNVAVSFQPTEGGLNPGAGSGGRTNDKGEYSLTVIGGGKGAVIGKHRVEIHPTVDGETSDDRGPPPKIAIPSRYNLKSELGYDVKPGHNTANFELKSK